MSTTTNPRGTLSRGRIAGAAVAAGVAAAAATLCAPWAVSAAASRFAVHGAETPLPIAWIALIAVLAGGYASWTAVRALRATAAATDGGAGESRQ